MKITSFVYSTRHTFSYSLMLTLIPFIPLLADVNVYVFSMSPGDRAVKNGTSFYIRNIIFRYSKRKV